MDTNKVVKAQALFDYDRQHFDELSFKTGDTIEVLKEIEGGWWHGELNGLKGWFPSNYVRKLLPSSRATETSHLLSFQQEIVQHILEGESKQIADLNALVKTISPNIDVLSKFPFLSKLSIFMDKISQLIHLHESIAKQLEKMKPISQPKFVGKLFLDVAKSLDQLTGEYTRSCAYVEFVLQENAVAVQAALGAMGRGLFSSKTRALLSSVHDRLSRYPILLKETERYYEDPHPDRAAICKAMQVYSEILDRCNLLGSLRKADIEVLSSEIRGLPDQVRLQLSDPTLTLEASVCVADAAGHWVVDSSKPQAVLLLYPACLLILSSSAPRTYQFRMQVPIANIAVTASSENPSVISLKIVSGGSPPEEHNLHLWCTGVCTRDLFFSTVTEFIRSSKWELEKVQFRHTANDGSSGPSRQRSATRAPGVGVGGAPPVFRRSSSCRSTSGGAAGILEEPTGASQPQQTFFELRPAHSGPLASPDVGENTPDGSQSGTNDLSTGPPCTNTVAVTDLTNLPGCRFLPHGCRARAIVKWPDDILSMAKRLEAGENGANNQFSIQQQQSQVEGHLTHLRLDCTALQSHASLLQASDGRGGGRSPMAAAGSGGGGGHSNRGSRQNSPGRAIGEGKGVATKVIRRKRTDELTQRNERDAKILQIIELYCGSNLPKGVLQPLDLTQLRLNCAEMRGAKETSLPPPQTLLSGAWRSTYEDTEPLRPPPVILPTSAAAHKS